MLYKINWGLVEVSKDNLTISDRRTRRKHKFRQIATKKDFYNFSFYPNTISDWNSLSEAIGMSDTLESFKDGISTITFEGPTTIY